MTVWQIADPSARLTDTDDPAPPHETTYNDAQESVNFVVFEPEWLPDDCTTTEITVRPEQPPGLPPDATAEDINQTPHSEGNPCSVRIVITGNERQLRLKQFLYDWAPPAASIAPLWRTSQPVPFECGDAIGWLGTDYKDRPGACVQRERTQIELSVSKGEFDDAEMKKLLRRLEPINTETSRLVRNVPFHNLSYWVRYQCRPPAVPHGLWTHNPNRPYNHSVIHSLIGLLDDSPVRPLVPTEDQFVFDSAAAFPEIDALEYLYRNRGNQSDYLWITASPAGSSLSLSLPPDASDQSAETRQAIELRETTVHYASLTEEYGAWEATWEEDGIHYIAWAGSSQFIDGDRFRTLIHTLETL